MPAAPEGAVIEPSGHPDRASLRGTWPLRLAVEADASTLEDLIHASVHSLQAAHYSRAQMDAAIGPVFGVDLQLVRDGTYFVAEKDGVIVGCGGWSRRRSLFGGSSSREGADPPLDPLREPARIRAFFVRPGWDRRGIGSSILAACESAVRQAGFSRTELVATLAGEPLYARFGYVALLRHEIPLGDGLGLPVVSMAKDFASRA